MVAHVLPNLPAFWREYSTFLELAIVLEIPAHKRHRNRRQGENYGRLRNWTRQRRSQHRETRHDVADDQGHDREQEAVRVAEGPHAQDCDVADRHALPDADPVTNLPDQAQNEAEQ